MKGYLAGSLFNKAEVKERLREGELIRQAFPEESWYNPIEEPINDKSKLPTAQDIFAGDYQAVLDSDVIIADLTNNDTGVAMELGIAIGLAEATRILRQVLADSGHSQEEQAGFLEDLAGRGIKERTIYAHNSDIRVATAGSYQGHHVPYGQNQFVVGGVEAFGEPIFSSIEEVIAHRQKEK